MTPSKLQHDLGDLAVLVSRVRIPACADRNTIRTLTRQLFSLMARANAAADSVLELEPVSGGHQPELPCTRELGLQRSRRPSLPMRLGDLAFVMRIELMHKQRALEALSDTAPTDSWTDRKTWLLACESCRNGLEQSLALLKQALSGGLAETAPATTLQRSLLVRECYARLRNEAELIDLNPAPEHRRETLLAVSTLLGRFVASAAYPLLRITDRHQVTALERRLLSALLAPETPPSSSKELRDFEKFMELLGMINHRQELKEHDRHYARLWLVKLGRQLDPNHGPPQGFSAYQKHLYGLDQELDALFGSTVPVNREALMRVLTRLTHSRTAVSNERPTKPDSRAFQCAPELERYASAPLP